MVILNWNGEVLLERFLPSVMAYSEHADIYVADNASTDGSIAFLRNNYPSITVIKNDSNGGFAKGYNNSLKQVSADIFCLLNSDVEVTPNWLNPIAPFFKAHPDVAVLQPKILDLLKKDHFEYAGAAGGFIDQLGYPFCRGRIFQSLEQDKGQYNDTREIFWATGACMFVKKSVFEALNGFDEDYFAHQEEVDFCWRAKNLGHKVYYTSATRVYHLGGSTLSNMNPRKTYLNFRNSLFSIAKNLPVTRSFAIIFIRLALDGIAALRFIFQFRFRHCFAILRAHFSFYRQLPKTLRKREKASFTEAYYATRSIVWSYFVHGIRKFHILVKD